VPFGRGVRPPCDDPTPGGAAFDDASPASDESPASLLLYLKKEEKSPARRQSFPGVAFSAAPRAGDPASDAPCRAPRLPIAERPRSARTASTACASTQAASPIRGAFHRQVHPLAFAESVRHRAWSFAAPGRLPALFRPSRRSRGEELDPDGGDGLFTRGRPDRAPLANFCNRNEMRAQSLDRSNPAHRAGVAFGAANAAGGQDPFRSSAGRDVTGQGRLGVNHARASSHRDRSRRKLYPNPIRSRTPPVANLFPPGAGEASAEDVPCIRGTSTGSPGWAPLSRNPAV
jgi:hypothetical protein